jgi:hypothetical protein
MEPEGSLLCSQEPATGSYTELDSSSTHPLILSSYLRHILQAASHNSVERANVTTCREWIPGKKDPRSVRYAYWIILSILSFFLSSFHIPLNYSIFPSILLFSTYTRAVRKVRGLAYYSESELYGGAVTVSISKYLPWQAMHFLQRSTHFSKTCCRPLITLKFLASELPFHGWKNLEIA